MTTPKRSTSRNTLLLLLCSAHLMGLLDASIVHIALPSIQHEIKLSAAGLQWVITAYTLCFGGFLLLGGKIGDHFGRRRTLISGLALFTIASVFGGLASDPYLLISARALQGLGAAFIAPNVMSIVTTLFAEGKERNRALGMLGSVSAVGFLLGLILGGLLTSLLNWRWVFFINVPIGLTVIVLLTKLLPESQPTRNPVDVPGAILVTLGLSCLVYAFTLAEPYGIFAAPTLALFLVAVGLFIAFIQVQRLAEHPLIPLSIFRNPALIGSGLITIVFGALIGPLIYILSLYMQNVLGYSPILTGLAFLPQEVTVLVTASLIGKYVSRIGTKPILLAGMCAFGIGAWRLAQLSVEANYWRILLPGILFVGIGVACVIVAAAIAFISTVAPQHQGIASGLWNTAPQIGTSLGWPYWFRWQMLIPRSPLLIKMKFLTL
ncbi:MFS transporter [Paenibacillus harenae]|uniref:MFS transporter n=1 Tax=Paenibacillus harenae TaxID=306543 RepID=UPI000424216D|nr:MFS transporter [Paenibacillus harenae]